MGELGPPLTAAGRPCRVRPQVLKLWSQTCRLRDGPPPRRSLSTNTHPVMTFEDIWNATCVISLVAQMTAELREVLKVWVVLPEYLYWLNKPGNLKIPLYFILYIQSSFLRCKKFYTLWQWFYEWKSLSDDKKMVCNSLVDSLLKVTRLTVFLRKNWLGFRNATLSNNSYMIIWQGCGGIVGHFLWQSPPPQERKLVL